MKVTFYKNTLTKDITLSLLGREPDENEVVLKANTTDGAFEKHVPVIEMNGDEVKVTVGSVLHPMTDAHYISMICLVTDQKAEVKRLTPTDQPIATFKLAEGEKVISAYEYCNLHGLWVKEA